MVARDRLRSNTSCRALPRHLSLGGRALTMRDGAMNMNSLRLILALLLLSPCPGAVPAFAETPVSAETRAIVHPGANPAINRHYQNPDYEVWRARFERAGREVYDQRHAIVDASALKPGMAVADIGAGTGLFTELFARAVGERGRVYALDISAEFMRRVEERMRGQDLANVQTVVNDARDTRLPAGSIDLAFVCDTYHHFEDPRAMLTSIRRALRPGGRLIVIDFRKQPGISSEWVMGHVRAAKQTVIEEIMAAGFTLRRDADLEPEGMLLSNFFLEFTKTE